MKGTRNPLIASAGALVLFALLFVGRTAAEELSVTPSTLTRTGALALSADASTYVFRAAKEEGSGLVLSSYSAGDRQTSIPDSFKGLRASLGLVGVTKDGSAVVANFEVVISGGGLGRAEGFRWTQAAGWVALGFTATGMNADGTVIVGYREGSQSGIYRWQAVVSRNGGAAVSLPRVDGSKINGRIVKVSGDGRVIAGTQNKEDYDPKSLLLRWVDDLLVPLLPVTGCFPRLISDDGNRIFYTEISGKCFVLVGDEPPLRLQTPSYASGNVTRVSSSGLLASDDDYLVWDRGGRYRKLTFDLQDFAIPSGQSVGDILLLTEDGENARAFTTTGAIINFTNPNQGDPVPLTSGAMLDASGKFEPQIKISESYREELTPALGATGAPYATGLKGNSRFSVTASMAETEVATFTADTVLSLHVGDYRFTGKLGDDLKYSVGKNRASFVTTGVVKGKTKVVGTLTWAWGKGKLKVTGKFADPEQFGLAYRRYVGWSGAVSGWVPVEIGIAGASGSCDAIWLSGKSGDTKSDYTSQRVRTVTLAGSNKVAPAW